MIGAKSSPKMDAVISRAIGRSDGDRSHSSDGYPNQEETVNSTTSAGPATRTVTVAHETDGDPVRIVEVLADAHNLSHWAPAVADEATRTSDERWLVRKDADQFEVRVVVNEGAATVDYLRQRGPGEWLGAFLRVIDRPGGGAVIVMTLPVIPGLDLAGTAAILDSELRALSGLVHRG
jgi:hypothetical protein